MTDSTFERSPRAMSPSPSSGPAYVGRHRAESSDPLRTGARMAARGLVVLGVAGAAWLLSSSAAQASDDRVEAGSTTGVVTGLVSMIGEEGRTGEPGLVLGTANELLTRVVPPSSTISVPMVTADRLPDLAITAATGIGADGVLTGTVPGPLDPVLRPVPLALIARVSPARAARGPAASDGWEIATITTRPVVQTEPVDAAQAVGSPAAQVAATAGGEVLTGTSGARRIGGRGHRGLGRTHAPVAGRIDPLGTHHVPQFPRPAPAPAAPVVGMGTGVSSAGSNLGQAGGPSVTAPSTTATGPEADRRPKGAVEVEVRRLHVESPTISPD